MKHGKLIFEFIFFLTAFLTMNGAVNAKTTKVESKQDVEYLKKTVGMLNDYPDDTVAYLSKKGAIAVGDATITDESGSTRQISDDKDYTATTTGDIKRSYETKIENANKDSKVNETTVKKKTVKKIVKEESFWDKIKNFFS